MSTTLDGNTYVNGNLSARSMSIPADTIDDTAVDAAAGIQATKLQQQVKFRLAQVHGSAASAERRPVHRVYGATGTLVSFKCGVVVACIGDSTITVALKKNGSNILTSSTVLDNTNTAYTVEDQAGFTSTSLTQGDVLEIAVTVSAGTGTLGQGLFCEGILREDPS